jgi:hypothetical protein
MTTSDLERTLAEARVAAARRLQSLRRAEASAQQPDAAPEPHIVARHEPAPIMAEPVDELSRVPPEQVVRIDPPAIPERSAPRLEAAPEPAVARPQPPGFGQDAGNPGPREAQYRQTTELGYISVAPISRAPPPSAGPPVAPAEALRHEVPRDHADLRSDEIRPEPDFMARLLAGVAAFRRSRAERRALAAAQAEAAPVEPRRQALTAKERRWERRRKRYLFEEILGWILVPIILVAIYYFVLWVLELSGIAPHVLVEGLQTIWSQFR